MNLEKLNASRAAAVTPHDVNALTFIGRALYIGGAGNVRLLTIGDDDVTFVGLPAGSILPVRCKQVFATSTTATSIVVLA